ncbi:MAG: carbohydrate kinase family protein [Anaerolineae bacterium]|nr:carbohydrate kinase family protein [Anaerolineae bacterium]
MEISASSIVVLGGTALDLLARVPYYPITDGNVVATSLARQPGGVGANVAVGMARLGQQVILLGAMGNDETGDFLRAELEDAGVDMSYVLIRPNMATQSCFIAVNPRGERRIYALPGAVILETPAELNEEVIRQARALHIAPCYKEVALAAIALAREYDLFVSYAPADVYWPQGPQAVREVARQVDLLILNRVEAAGLTGLDDPRQSIERLLEWGYGPLVLTLGEEGVLIGDQGRALRIPAYPVSGEHGYLVEDTTGAGDAFTAGLVTGILMGLSLDRAARLGTAVAALKLRESGAQAGLPTLEEALQLALQRAELLVHA